MSSGLNVARLVAQTIATSEKVSQAADNDKRWKWGNYRVVAFPDTKCPYCLGIFRNKAIWFVSADWERLKGQVIPQHGQPFKLTAPDHPHAERARETSAGGYICHGNANPEDVATTLFLGINPLSLINRDVHRWLRDYCDHACEAATLRGSTSNRQCAACGHTPEHDIGTCSTCWPNDTDCRSCGVRVVACLCGCGCIAANGACGCNCEECVCDDMAHDDD